MKRNITFGLGLVAAVTSLLMGTGVTPAWATQIQICGNSGSGYCLNDWGGGDFAGDPVKMYYGGSSSEHFQNSFLSGMCNNGYVTSTCPALGSAQSSLIGQPLYRIDYGPGGCVADNGSYKAVIGNCPSDSGSGGSDGSIFIEVPYGPGSCRLFSREQSDYWGTPVGLNSGGSVGAQATTNGSGSGLTYWGGPGVDC